MTEPPRRFRSTWRPNVAGGLVSFVIEVAIVAVLAGVALGVAVVGLWIL